MYPGDIDWTNPTKFIAKMIEKMMKEYEEQGIDITTLNENTSGEKSIPLLFAPDCIEKDGKYYLYFCLNDGRGGVAVSDRPEGPFLDAVQLPCGGIDPAVFIDDDGKAYYYWGQIHSHGVRLNEDMISFAEEEAVDNLMTEEEHFFHEGSSVRKIGDTYYCVFADVERDKPTALGYATSKSPLGPYKYQGIIIDNADCDSRSWNNHGSIECFDGQWYIFYHRSSQGTDKNRRLCIEPIQIEEDGTVKEVKMTSQGIGGPFLPGEEIMGYQACGLKGSIYIGMDTDKNEKLVNISEGDEAYFRYVQTSEKSGEIKIEAQGSGIIEVFLDDAQIGQISTEDGKQRTEQIQWNQSGVYELKLRFLQPDQLTVNKITLF